ncbi:hypothetical protein B0A50_04445 [Salinomyces thailandicus]|uniref:Uncharacterized protein n=1 Tax=Salinomyces thailandicus TaxID=706561 RepID=A0A4U0TYL3_9PEZI|nr:hypothetical protein B0A50_04445 [Salinomyces thailandica]
MTDNLRQGAGDKLASNMKPDSQKTTMEQGSDKAKGAADSVAGTLQPEDQKSTTQQATDSSSSYMDQASEALGNAGQQISDTLGLSGGKK